MKFVIDVPEEELIKAVVSRLPQAETRADKMAREYGETITKKRAADMLGISATTLWRLISDKKIKTCLEGRMIDTRSLAKYLDKP